jgi:glycosyltransferase involved in cell wall biosynthesis
MPSMHYFAFQGIVDERMKREIGPLEGAGWRVSVFLIHPRRGWVVREEIGRHLILPTHIVSSAILDELIFFPIFIMLRYLPFLVGKDRPKLLFIQNFPDSNSFVLLLLGKLFRIPTVYEIQDPWKEFVLTETSRQAQSRSRFAFYFNLMTIIEHLATRLASGVVFSSESLRQWHQAETGNKPTFLSNNYSEYHNDTKTQSQGKKIRKELKLDTDIVVSYIGGFQSYRGVDILLTSMVKVLIGNRKVKLLLVGARDATLDQIRERARELGIQENCIEIPWVPSERMVDYFAASDIGVIPYRRTPATELCCPNKLFSYLVLGKPVIISNLTELSRHFRDESCGLKVKPDDPEDLSKAILQLINNPEMRERMSRTALSMSDAYSYENVKTGFLDFINEVTQIAQN